MQRPLRYAARKRAWSSCHVGVAECEIACLARIFPSYCVTPLLFRFLGIICCHTLAEVRPTAGDDLLGGACTAQNVESVASCSLEGRFEEKVPVSGKLRNAQQLTSASLGDLPVLPTVWRELEDVYTIPSLVRSCRFHAILGYRVIEYEDVFARGYGALG